MTDQSTANTVQIDQPAIYDGEDLFGEQFPQDDQTSEEEDPLKRILMPQNKAYGEMDGRHKRK